MVEMGGNDLTGSGNERTIGNYWSIVKRVVENYGLWEVGNGKQGMKKRGRLNHTMNV